MIRPLAWDSEFFGRKMGSLTGELSSYDGVVSDLRTAAGGGFEYILCRPPIGEFKAIQALEAAGFYLVDIGAIWSADPSRYLAGITAAGSGEARLATRSDAAELGRRARTLFRDSRFYHDPFFSAEEADRLHAAWVENSVAGTAADAVWMIPDAGFVTCKLADGIGDIGLIGVWDGQRRRGSGRALVTAAVAWFAAQGARLVTVKTQMKNTTAMAFYRRLGFDWHTGDITMACRLSEAGGTGRARA